MSLQQAYQNWRVATDTDQIAWLWLDRHDSNVNTLNKPVLDELNHILDTLHESATTRGVIIGSAKILDLLLAQILNNFRNLPVQMKQPL